MTPTSHIIYPFLILRVTDPGLVGSETYERGKWHKLTVCGKGNKWELRDIDKPDSKGLSEKNRMKDI